MRLDELTTWFPLGLLRAFVFAFGLLWGSFLNVVIYRLPRDLSVVRPGSMCPACGTPIRAFDNVPVLAFLWLRGRARCCGAKMSPRYPLVELLGGALSLAILEAIVLRLPGSTPAGRALAIYGADFTLALGLVAAAFIDAEHMILPDSVTLGGTVLGLATASFRDLCTREAFLGAAAGFGVIYVPFIFLFKGFFGRSGMGMGDAKLLALAGAWFGWPGALFTLLAGAIHGTLFYVITRIAGIELTLPKAVLDDIEELKRAAENGDEDAKRALEEDPLTESADDAFILQFFRRLLGRPPRLLEAVEEEAEQAEETEEPKRHLPFGPFLILALLELLFAADWIREQVFLRVIQAGAS
jgi:leader peptidase (prepilin peptidase)/N-methyltransferase